MLVAAGGTWIDPEPVGDYVRLAGKGATVMMPDGLEVDLHRILVWGPFGVRVPDEELWANRREFLFAGVPRDGLGREETLLHVALHLLVLGTVRAREVRDVGQLLCSPELDVERLLVLARRWGQEAVLATAIRMADRELAARPRQPPAVHVGGRLPGDGPRPALAAHGAAGWAVSADSRLWPSTPNCPTRGPGRCSGRPRCTPGPALGLHPGNAWSRWVAGSRNVPDTRPAASVTAM